MNRKTLAYLCFAVLMAAGIALMAVARLGASALPSATKTSLASLKDAFRGMCLGPDPYSLEEEVTRNAAVIHSILTYANSSASAKQALSNHLISELDGFISRFAPGMQLDEGIVGKRTFERGEEPWYGLTVDTYLLLDLASSTRSAAYTRQVLESVYAAQQSLAHFFDAAEIVLAMPGAPGHPERGQSCPPLQYGSAPGAELAWCCEQFMMEGYTSGAFLDLPEAQAVISDYKQWRDQALAKRGMEKWLPVDCAGVTMEYVKKLADALP